MTTNIDDINRILEAAGFGGELLPESVTRLISAIRKAEDRIGILTGEVERLRERASKTDSHIKWLSGVGGLPCEKEPTATDCICITCTFLRATTGSNDRLY